MSCHGHRFVKSSGDAKLGYWPQSTYVAGSACFNIAPVVKKSGVLVQRGGQYSIELNKAMRSANTEKSCTLGAVYCSQWSTVDIMNNQNFTDFYELFAH